MSPEPKSLSRPVPNEAFGVELVRDWSPETTPRATVILLHGIADHSGRYEGVGSHLAGAGYQVRSFDLRGAGASGGRRWDIADWVLYLDQIESHLRWARDEGLPVTVYGHSMGGTLALDYALSERNAPDLLVVSAPAVAAGAAWQRAVAAVLGRLAPTVSIPNRVAGHMLSKDPAVGEAYFADPLVHTSSTPRLGHHFFAAMDRVRKGSDRLRIPTLVVHGGDDRLVAPESTAPLAENRIVDRYLYPGLRHEVHNEPEGPKVLADIVEWIDRHL